MYPMVPSYNLKKLRREIDDQLPKPFNSLFDFYKAGASISDSFGNKLK
jgi:fatty acid desaturase